jgi:hypothetical protein
MEFGLFHQLHSTWTVNNGRRDLAMFGARVICMSIDRHYIPQLAAIRPNKCNTPPLVET